MPVDFGNHSSVHDKGLNLTSLSSQNLLCLNSSNQVASALHTETYGQRVGSKDTASLQADWTVQDVEVSQSQYDPTLGYGLINASAAVSKAIGQKTFADVPNLGGYNWGADLIKAPEVWAKGYTGQGIVVAVLDTGVDYQHNDLQSNIWTNANEIPGNNKDDDGNGYVDDFYGWDFANNNNDTLDANGHGTHVAGTIAGVNNNFGVTGIAYDAQIMPVQVLGDSGSGSYSAIANGIYYAVDNGADVINLSLGGRYPNDTIMKALEYASNKGTIVVMAAGNDGSLLPGYPARYANRWGLAVGAVDRDNELAYFSNRAGIDPLAYVTAPGVDVYSTLPNNSYAAYNGTSMAAPHVAGVVALILSANGTLTDAQIRQIVAETAVNQTQTTTFHLSNEYVTHHSYSHLEKTGEQEKSVSPVFRLELFDHSQNVQTNNSSPLSLTNEPWHELKKRQMLLDESREWLDGLNSSII